MTRTCRYLGGTQGEVADALDVSQPTVSADTKNGSSAVSGIRAAKVVPIGTIFRTWGIVLRATRLGRLRTLVQICTRGWRLDHILTVTRG